MKTTVRITGLSDLEKALSNLSAAVSKRTARAALRQAAQPMAEKAQELAPVRSGKLKNSIRVGTMLNGRQKKLRKRAMTEDEKHAVTVFVGPSYIKGDKGRHGHLVEFGTKPRINGGKFAGSKHPGTKPQPFMRPAFQAEAGPTIERLKPLLYKAIERAAKREARRAAKGR